MISHGTQEYIAKSVRQIGQILNTKIGRLVSPYRVANIDDHFRTYMYKQVLRFDYS